VRRANGHLKKWCRGSDITAAFLVFLFVGLLLRITGDGYLCCKNPGLKFSRSYSPNEYRLQHQNWSILQDYRGVIYAANGGGVLEYDGVSWSIIEVTNHSVYSLVLDNAGTIYVGGINELGFLAPNSKGQMEYISLLQHVVDEARNFGKVWKIHTTEEGIYFRTQKYLFLWNPQLKQMKFWQPKKSQNVFNASFTCNERYFIKQTNVGLMQMEKDSLKIVPGCETFASIQTMFIIAPYDSTGKKLLIGTREKGFFIHDGEKMEAFPTEVDEYIKEKKASYGIALSRSPGDIVIATLRGGIVIIDRQGNLKHIFTKVSGLLDNNVKYVFEDSQGNLWAALNEGIAKIEYLSPLSIYDDRSQLSGMVYTIIRHSGVLYAGTSQGLFYLSFDNNKFNPIPAISSACWSLISIGDSVLAAASNGVYQLKNGTIRKITRDPSYTLLQSRHSPNRIWVGMRSGLASICQNLKQGDDEWIEELKCEKIVQEIRTIVEDQDGNLWLGARAAGVIKVVLKGNSTIENCNIVRYDTSRQLPEGVVQVCWAAGHVMFGTKKGIFRFDETKDMFVMDDTLGKTFVSELKDVYRVVEDRKKSIWLHDKGQNYHAIPKPDGTYEIREKPLARIPVGWQVNTIYPDPLEDVTWFGTHEGLVRFEPGVKKDYNHEYRTIIRRILINGTPHFYNYTSPSERSTKHVVPVFAYNGRNFRFDFAAPFFEHEAVIKYSYFLEGYDKKWSLWNKEAYKDYTNLDSGVYTFRVKARNVYHNESREAVFQFKILPPWYKTWWAFLIYAILLFLVVFLMVWWRSRKLQLEKQKLERVIKERTKEINRKNQQLEKQTFLLQDQAEKLKELDHAKSRFFANISHEFRTPLTLINGPLEHILSSHIPTGMREKLNLMHRNSHRLLKLINRLLDLSRIDSGKMKLKTAPQDIISFLKGILASFEHSVREKKLDLGFYFHDESITLYFDTEKMEDVFDNLLSNAVKFTPEGGKIIVSIKCIMEEQEDFPSGSLEVSIRDTGVGIPIEQLAHIFDRFYQVESHKRKNKGSGIGLALTRELVNLHHGKIDVNSRVGENSGTDFILRFPLGKDHLNPDEIIDSSEMEFISRRFKQGGDVENGFEEIAVDEIWMEERDSKPGTRETEKEKEKKVVLVVEDNSDMRKFIRESIEPYYSVIEAENGKDGIEKAQAIMPDLIVSDIMMPEIDGYELCETLKKDFKTSHTPIILLTAKASESSVVQGLETGADDYITKPFNTKILLTRIKNLIDLRRQLQEKIQRQMLLQPEEIKVSSIDQKFLKKLQDIIEENLSDPDLNVEALSEKMDITRVTLNKKIHALSGETANEFIRSYRLKRSVQLLKQNFGSVTDVAFEVGFSNHSYFTKCFREKFHQLPSALAVEETEEKKRRS
jgi:signal transduction histidine kinase/DNA-binding response OmpR family regulator